MIPDQSPSLARDPRQFPELEWQSRFRGCFLGGAVGDALGAPVEFLSRKQILQEFGDSGIRDFKVAYGRLGAITDDTQMALFTAEGVLRAYIRAATRGICNPTSVIANAYLRWLHTQGVAHQRHVYCLNGWLIAQRDLFASRAPGRTCIGALVALENPGSPATNDSKGCGGVMRVAPIGMMFAGSSRNRKSECEDNLGQAFELGCDAAGVTHGHPTGKLASGAFAALIFLLMQGKPLKDAVEVTLEILQKNEGHEETSRAIQHAFQLAENQPGDPDVLRLLGEGWIAEEALAIGLYCALGAKDFESGVVLAVNHSGDSDSTGLIAGHILGVIYGESSIPLRWLEPLELRDVICEVANDLATCGQWDLDCMSDYSELDFYAKRYPPG